MHRTNYNYTNKNPFHWKSKTKLKIDPIQMVYITTSYSRVLPNKKKKKNQNEIKKKTKAKQNNNNN